MANVVRGGLTGPTEYQATQQRTQQNWQNIRNNIATYLNQQQRKVSNYQWEIEEQYNGDVTQWAREQPARARDFLAAMNPTNVEERYQQLTSPDTGGMPGLVQDRLQSALLTGQLGFEQQGQQGQQGAQQGAQQQGPSRALHQRAYGQDVTQTAQSQQNQPTGPGASQVAQATATTPTAQQPNTIADLFKNMSDILRGQLYPQNEQNVFPGAQPGQQNTQQNENVAQTGQSQTTQPTEPTQLQPSPTPQTSQPENVVQNENQANVRVQEPDDASIGGIPIIFGPSRTWPNFPSLSREEAESLRSQGKSIYYIEQPGGGSYYPTKYRPPQLPPEGKEWTREEAQQEAQKFFDRQKAWAQGIQEAEEKWRK